MSNNNYIINKTFDNQSSITTSSINVTTINDIPASQIVYVDVSNNISTENVNTTFLNNKATSKIVFYDTSNNISTVNVNTTFLNNKSASQIVFYDISNNMFANNLVVGGRSYNSSFLVDISSNISFLKNVNVAGILFLKLIL